MCPLIPVSAFFLENIVLLATNFSIPILHKKNIVLCKIGIERE